MILTTEIAEVTEKKTKIKMNLEIISVISVSSVV